jgi:hypothetical protein
VRREHFALSPQRSSAETPARMVVTTDLFDFGVRAQVVPPPAGSVVDSADVAVPS